MNTPTLGPEVHGRQAALAVELSRPMRPRERLEISDLIVDYDPRTLVRRPVRQAEVVRRLEASGDAWGARFVGALPAKDGVLDEATCDAILVRAHTELQRLSEEFLQVDRIRRILSPLLTALRSRQVPGPYRIVDVGCGTGYLVRALAAFGRLGRDVKLLGCDMNVALVRHARALADEEHLDCELFAANAFTLAEPAHVFLSTGVLHHVRGDELARFFEGQRAAQAFIHFDTQPSWLSPIGSWIFHQARMREPLVRHDGVVSAARTHSRATLLRAAASTGFTCRSFDGASSWWEVLVRPLHAVIGVRAELFPTFEGALGPLAARLAEPS